MPSPVLREIHALRERSEHEIRRLVARAISDGARTQDIAEALGVSRSTLWRRYRGELRRDEAASER